MRNGPAEKRQAAPLAESPALIGGGCAAYEDKQEGTEHRGIRGYHGLA